MTQEQRKKISIFMIFIFMGMLLSGGLIFLFEPMYKNYFLERYNEELSKQEISSVMEKKEILIKIARKYIITNSSRISNKMAKEVAIGAINTNIPVVMLAIMKIESSYNPTSVSPTGAIGLTQIMEIHIPVLIREGIISEKRDLFDIDMNIRAGNFLFNVMWTKNKGDIVQTLMNYYGKYDDTYFRKFMSSYFELKYLFDQSL